MRRRALIILATIAVSAVVAVAVFWSGSTSVVEVRNSTSHDLMIPNCSDDPATISSGQVANLYHPDRQCIVTTALGGKYWGCLTIPSSSRSRKAIVDLTTSDSKVPEVACKN